jgi:NDP-hexose-3-ketoreductase
MFVYHAQHVAVRELVAEGAIGDVRGFTCAFTIPPKPEGDIRYRADISGGPFLDMGGYPVRAATYFLGDELKIIGAVFRYSKEHDLVMSGAVLAHAGNGAVAQLTFGMEHSYVNRYVLSGSTGRILLDRVFTPPATYQPVLVVERQNHREERVLPPDDQFANVLGSFARAVLHSEDVSAAQESSLQQALLIDDIRRQATRVPI